MVAEWGQKCTWGPAQRMGGRDRADAGLGLGLYHDSDMLLLATLLIMHPSVLLPNLKCATLIYHPKMQPECWSCRHPAQTCAEDLSAVS